MYTLYRTLNYNGVLKKSWTSGCNRNLTLQNQANNIRCTVCVVSIDVLWWDEDVWPRSGADCGCCYSGRHWRCESGPNSLISGTRVDLGPARPIRHVAHLTYINELVILPHTAFRTEWQDAPFLHYFTINKLDSFETKMGEYFCSYNSAIQVHI